MLWQGVFIFLLAVSQVEAYGVSGGGLGGSGDTGDTAGDNLGSATADDMENVDALMGDELDTSYEPVQIPPPRHIQTLINLFRNKAFLKSIMRAFLISERQVNTAKKEAANTYDRGVLSRKHNAALKSLAYNNRPTGESTRVSVLGDINTRFFAFLVKRLKMKGPLIRFLYTLSRKTNCNNPLLKHLAFYLRHAFNQLKCPYRNQGVKCQPGYPYRTYDGSCNNKKNPTWGMASIPFRRFLMPKYADSVGEPFTTKTFTGNPQASARRISVLVNERIPKDAASISHMTMQFGQFIDHDITLAPHVTDEEGHEVPTCCVDNSNFRNAPLRIRQARQKLLDKRPECIAIPITNDAFFTTRSCFNQIRSEPAMTDGCSLGYIEYD